VTIHVTGGISNGVKANQMEAICKFVSLDTVKLNAFKHFHGSLINI